ncbi:unnamed protein product [Sphagnum balticum]
MPGRFVPPATAVPRPRLNAAAVVNKTKRKNTEKAVRKAVEEAEKIANTLPSASHQLPRPTLDGNAPAAAPFRTAALEGILHNELQSLRYHDELIRAITIQNGEYIVHSSSSLDWSGRHGVSMPALYIIARCGAVTPLASVRLERVFSMFS